MEQREYNGYILDKILDEQEISSIAKINNIMMDFCAEAHDLVSQIHKHDFGKLVGSQNISEDHMTHLDQLLNDLAINFLGKSDHIHAIISEEMENPLILDQSTHNKYLIALDPLDGSSNIDVGMCVGVIWGIYDLKIPTYTGLESFSGQNLVAAGYCMFNAATFLTISVRGLPTRGYTYCFYFNVNNCKQEKSTLNMNWNLINSDMKIPLAQNARSPSYSINESLVHKTRPIIQDFMLTIRERMSIRYAACMIGDIHRILIKGGIFIYPRTATGKLNEKGKPIYNNGKLRYFYEIAPMAFIVTNSGGSCEPGLFNFSSANVHVRHSAIIGSKDLIEEYENKLLLET